MRWRCGLTSLSIATAALLSMAVGCRPGSEVERGARERSAGVVVSKVIKIVSGLPRTDSAVAQTDTIVNGIRMALEEANYQAGGFAIEYADWDDATSLHSCGPSLIPQWY
ncbi:MAG: hypothetical protein A2V98_18165 [Planctomycetes bacterium RBG_16_64_12]|nr:MAG: hypothetical protein A2V98_18165 [Planctomycetes bacterium RBG_16_64_12]